MISNKHGNIFVNIEGCKKLLNKLSSNLWMKNRKELTKDISNLFESLEKKKKKLINLKLSSIDCSDNNDKYLLYLYSRLNLDEKKKFIQHFDLKTENINICKGCYNICKLNKKKKCIHTDCEGMCNNCSDKIKDTCLVCHKNQKIDCPICLETTDSENLIKSDNCEHSVCSKCYSHAFAKGKPMYACPCCRSQFNQRYTIKGKKIPIIDDFDKVEANDGNTYYINRDISNAIYSNTNLNRSIGYLDETNENRVIHLYT